MLTRVLRREVFVPSHINIHTHTRAQARGHISCVTQLTADSAVLLDFCLSENRTQKFRAQTKPTAKGKEEFHHGRNGIKCAGGKLLFRIATSVAFTGKTLMVACMLGSITLEESSLFYTAYNIL